MSPELFYVKWNLNYISSLDCSPKRLSNASLILSTSILHIWAQDGEVNLSSNVTFLHGIAASVPNCSPWMFSIRFISYETSTAGDTITAKTDVFGLTFHQFLPLSEFTFKIVNIGTRIYWSIFCSTCTGVYILSGFIPSSNSNLHWPLDLWLAFFSPPNYVTEYTSWVLIS
jgi:hypothetical protein